MKRICKIRVDSIEASTKFEGKWVAMLALDGEREAQRFWMSHKQMTSIHRNLDKGTLFAAFDYDAPKGPRFIWASTDTAWLEKAFLTPTIANKAEQIQSIVNTIKAQPVVESSVDFDDLPF